MTLPLTQAALTAEIRTLLARWIADVFDAKQREGLHGNIRMLGNLETALTPFCAQIEAAGQALEKRSSEGHAAHAASFAALVALSLGLEDGEVDDYNALVSRIVERTRAAEAQLDCHLDACPSDPPCARHQIAALTRENDVAADEIAVLSNSLERAEYDLRRIRCSYCGATYPQETESRPDGLLAGHIAVCEKHPLRKALVRAEQAEAALAAQTTLARDTLEDWRVRFASTLGISGKPTLEESVRAAGEQFVALAHAKIALNEKDARIQALETLTAHLADESPALAYQRGRASILEMVRKLPSPICPDSMSWHGEAFECEWCSVSWSVSKRPKPSNGVYDPGPHPPSTDCLYALAHAQQEPGEPT